MNKVKNVLAKDLLRQKPNVGDGRIVDEGEDAGAVVLGDKGVAAGPRQHVLEALAIGRHQGDGGDEKERGASAEVGA